MVDGVVYASNDAIIIYQPRPCLRMVVRIEDGISVVLPPHEFDAERIPIVETIHNEDEPEL